MDFKLNLTDQPKEPKAASMSYEEAQQSLLTLGFKGIKREKSQITTKYEWQPGHVVRTKAFFWAQYDGQPFHEVKDRPEQFFAVHNYYTRPGEDFSALEAIYKPSPNAFIIIHDHPVSDFCAPFSKCRSI